MGGSYANELIVNDYPKDLVLLSWICLVNSLFSLSGSRAPEGARFVRFAPSASRRDPRRLLPPDDGPQEPVRRAADAGGRSRSPARILHTGGRWVPETDSHVFVCITVEMHDICCAKKLRKFCVASEDYLNTHLS